MRAIEGSSIAHVLELAKIGLAKFHLESYSPRKSRAAVSAGGRRSRRYCQASARGRSPAVDGRRDEHGGGNDFRNRGGDSRPCQRSVVNSKTTGVHHGKA